MDAKYKLLLPFVDTDSFNVVDVVRIRNHEVSGCLSQIYINDKFECYGLEPYDRLFDDKTSLDVIKFQKSLALNNKTYKSALRYCAIPIGLYDLDLHHINPNYRNKRAYAPFNFECPQVLGILGYAGVNIHVGNFPIDTRGCLLVGQLSERSNGRFSLSSSTDTFYKFYKKLRSFKFPCKIRYSRFY